jgi:hypothetical protein
MATQMQYNCMFLLVLINIFKNKLRRISRKLLMRAKISENAPNGVEPGIAARPE